MHEYGLIEDVVKLVLREPPRETDRKVAAVRIEVGEFLVASRASLETAYEVLTRGTALEGSRLEVTEVPGRARCEACGFEGSGADLSDGLCEPPALLLCPACGALLLITEGAGIALLGVQLQDRGVPGADRAGLGGR